MNSSYTSVYSLPRKRAAGREGERSCLVVEVVEVLAKNSKLNRAALLKAIDGDAELTVKKSGPSHSISKAIDDLMRENDRLRMTITELESRLAASDDLVRQLRKALAPEEVRSARD